MEENFDEGIKAIEEGMQKLDQDVEILNQSSETLQNEINGLNNRRSIDQARFNSQIAQAKEDYVRRNGVDMPKSEEDIEVNHFNDLMKAEYQEKLDAKAEAIKANSEKIAELQAKKAKAIEDLDRMKTIDANLAESYMKYKVKNEEVNKLNEEANKLMAAKMAYFREAAKNGYPTYDFPGEAELEKAEENVKKAQAELAELKKPIISYGLDKQWAINTIANNLGMDSIDLSNSKAKYEDQNWYKNYVEEKKKAEELKAKEDEEKAKAESKKQGTEKDDIENVLNNAGSGTSTTAKGQSRSRGASADKNQKTNRKATIQVKDGYITIQAPGYGMQSYRLSEIDDEHFEELFKKADKKAIDAFQLAKQGKNRTSEKETEAFDELVSRCKKIKLMNEKFGTDNFMSYNSKNEKGFDKLIAKALQMYEFNTIEETSSYYITDKNKFVEYTDQNKDKNENDVTYYTYQAKTLEDATEAFNILDTMQDLRDYYDESVMTKSANDKLEITYDIREKPERMSTEEFSKLKKIAKDSRTFAYVKAGRLTRMGWRISDWFNGIKKKFNPMLPAGTEGKESDTKPSQANAPKEEESQAEEHIRTEFVDKLKVSEDQMQKGTWGSPRKPHTAQPKEENKDRDDE